jgi:hypothetical protein
MKKLIGFLFIFYWSSTLVWAQRKSAPKETIIQAPSSNNRSKVISKNNVSNVNTINTTSRGYIANCTEAYFTESNVQQTYEGNATYFVGSYVYNYYVSQQYKPPSQTNSTTSFSNYNAITSGSVYVNDLVANNLTFGLLNIKNLSLTQSYITSDLVLSFTPASQIYFIDYISLTTVIP